MNRFFVALVALALSLNVTLAFAGKGDKDQKKYNGQTINCKKLTGMDVAWFAEIGGAPLGAVCAAGTYPSNDTINSVEAGNAPYFVLKDAIDNKGYKPSADMVSVNAAYKAFKNAQSKAKPQK